MAEAGIAISADSHVVEPAEMFAPLAERFGERAPKMVHNEERGDMLDLGDGTFGRAIGGFLIAGHDVASPETRAMSRLGYKIARPGLYDIKARLEDQDLDGISAEVLYPSILFNVYQLEDVEIIKGTFACYNDWLADYAKEAPERLYPLACIQLHDIDAAIEEMERAAKLGHVGMCIPATAPATKTYTDPFYDKFWAAAQDMDMPLTMHIFTGASPRYGAPERLQGNLGYTLAFVGVAVTIGDLILSGVCERFPNLRFVPTEFETGWLGHFLQRLDWTHYRMGGHRDVTLSMKPSEYWQRNFRITFEDDEIGVWTREVSGVNTLMWGSDYPHGDSIFPDSQNILDRILKDCTPEERRMITAKNVVDLYKLPIEV